MQRFANLAAASFVVRASSDAFQSSFLRIAHKLLHLEGADAACLITLDETTILEFESGSELSIDAMIDSVVYQEKLHSSGPGVGWLFGADRYFVDCANTTRLIGSGQVATAPVARLR